jgi:acyl-CoA synthetase (AMP-forming)/AMP-acid ligase II
MQFAAKSGRKVKMKLTPIHSLLQDRTADQWQDYWESCGITFPQFPQHVKQIMQILRDKQATRLILFHQERHHFLAGFLAAIHMDIPLVLPPNNTPGLIQELTQAGDVIFADLEVAPSINEDPPLFPSINPGQTSLCFYTSGSTGVPKPIGKTLDQFEREITTLNQTWPIQGKVLSTVSHQHIYGLLFSLMWPVCKGLPLSATTYSFWENLLDEAETEHVIVSSPAHLGRFPLRIIPEHRPSYIFSSGGPLSLQASESTQNLLGDHPWEIYGSTETGGIAYRKQENENQPWKVFTGISIDIDENQKLSLQSPYLKTPEPYITEDRIAFESPQSFHLLGRADQTVKVEGKRLDLGELETRLLELDYVEEAAVVLTSAEQRDTLGAVLVLSPAGKTSLAKQGKFKFSREINQHLRLYLDPVLLPKRWRFVEKIPTTSQGKRQIETLKNLFEKTLGDVRIPEILSSKHDAKQAKIALKIPRDLAYFEGHFEGTPVVPGVVQLHWAFQFAQDLFDVHGCVTQGNRIKFNRLL